MISGIQLGTSALQGLTTTSSSSSSGAGSSSGSDFGTLLEDAMNNLNGTMNQANADAASYAMGGPVSITQLMTAEQQANIAVDTVSEVDKQVISDYQNVMNMSI